jgi:carboxypeptidase Q
MTVTFPLPRRLLLSLCAIFILSNATAADREPLDVQYQPAANKIIEFGLSDDTAFTRLAEMCDTFGPRFSGSQNLEDAIDWCLAKLNEDGFENVRGEPVTVPNWSRGRESARGFSPRPFDLYMLGLGGSVGTPPDGIRAPALVVSSFEELREKSAEAKGRIIVFNAPFTDYGRTVVFRMKGAIEAAKVGAVASLIRSVTPFSIQTPHTGMMNYDPDVPKIPHAAISIEDAEMLQRFQKRGEPIEIELKMEARTLPDAQSRNVVAELVGSEFPKETVVISGHIDSWDVGTGAMDDGGGCFASWQALRILKQLKLRPRRTIRLVFWTNEENGMAGVKSYRDTHEAELKNHLIAMESDAGTFAPEGFSFTGSEKAMALFEEFATLLKPLGADRLKWGAGVSDVMNLVPSGVPVMGLDVDRTKYFWYHHTDADTIDKLNIDEFNRCAAAMAIMAYVIADMPERLPR